MDRISRKGRMRLRHRLAPALTALLLVMTPSGLLGQEEEVGLFSVDLGLSVWTIVVFLLLLWVLRRFAWGPILGALDDRERRIQSSIDEANRLREEAEDLLKEHQAKVAQAQKEAQEIVNESRQAGERLRREVEEKARAEADRILKRAQWEIGLEKDRVLEEVRRESVDLVLAAASRLLQKELDQEADRELVKRYLDELAPPAKAVGEAEA